MDVLGMVRNAAANFGAFRDATRTGSLSVLLDLAGPAWRGLVVQEGKRSATTDVPSLHEAHFEWGYRRDDPELARLYGLAKRSQWDGATALDWDVAVDPHDESRELVMDEALPLREIPAYRGLDTRSRQDQRHALLAWLLSQFLHGEQGALIAACQVTESARSTDARLFGSTQVVDEGRHVEVFHRYLTGKLGKVYPVNDNLYVVLDALLSDSRWDLKFLGMQILVEGLALGAFATLRASTKEPLLRDLLRRVSDDEARHVRFGVLALEGFYATGLSPHELRDREDWAFELVVLLRNRFLAHEFYDEHYAHVMRRAEWDRLILGSEFMARFRETMFRRIIPNLKRIGLLSDRVRPRYEALGLLAYEVGKAGPELTAKDLGGE